MPLIRTHDEGGRVIAMKAYDASITVRTIVNSIARGHRVEVGVDTRGKRCVLVYWHDRKTVLYYIYPR